MSEGNSSWSLHWGHEEEHPPLPLSDPALGHFQQVFPVLLQDFSPSSSSLFLSLIFHSCSFTPKQQHALVKNTLLSVPLLLFSFPTSIPVCLILSGFGTPLLYVSVILYLSSSEHTYLFTFLFDSFSNMKKPGDNADCLPKQSSPCSSFHGFLYQLIQTGGKEFNSLYLSANLESKVI